MCGDQAGLLLPWQAAVNGKRSFCGLCFEAAKKNG
jgi:hypothetical protein